MHLPCHAKCSYTHPIRLRFSSVRIKSNLYEKTRDSKLHKPVPRFAIPSTCATCSLKKYHSCQVSSMNTQSEDSQSAENNEPSVREEKSERILLSAVLTLVLSILGRYAISFKRRGKAYTKTSQETARLPPNQPYQSSYLRLK